MVDITREGIESEIQSYVGKSKVAPTIPTGDLYNEEYFAFVSDGMSVWKAAFRQYNPLYSLERMVEDSLAGYVNDSNYDPAGDRRIPEDSLWRFRDSGSYAESTVLLERLRQDQSDLAMLNASNSTFEGIVASLATPTVLAPLAPLRFLRSTSALNRFVGGGAFTAAIMAPEELLMAEQLQTRDASHAALSLAAAGIIGGSLTGALGGRSFNALPKGFKKESSLDIDGEPVYQAAGAGVSPSQARRTAFATMENDALKETGVGLEKLPWNPVIRMLQSENPFVRSLAVGMVDVGGMMQKKVDREIAMDQSVETTFRTTYLTPLLNSIREADTAYLAYRGVVAKPTDVGRSLQMMGQMGKDVVKGRRGYLSQIEFRERVGRAMRNGDADTVSDAASQYVNRAATEYRKLFNKIKDEATAVGLFQRQLQAEIVAAREAGDAAKIADLEAALQRINEQGVTVNTALSYLPRVYRVDKIMANPDAFIQRVANWAITSKGMSRPQAEKFANEVLDTVTNSRPYLDLDDATGLDFVVKPGSIKQRTLEIPDNLIDDFLENDVEVLARHHTKSMGMDIEIARKYGSIDMREVLEEIVNEWDLIIGGTKKAEAKVFNKVTGGMDDFANHFETGKPSAVKMFRGSGGDGKVAFDKNAFGAGTYLARTVKTAKLFGSKIKEYAVNLKNPIVFKSDEDILTFYAKYNPQKAAALRSAKEALFREIDEISKLMVKSPTAEQISAFTARFETLTSPDGLLAKYNTLRKEVFDELPDLVKSEGFDSAVFSMRAMFFQQATRGQLTGSKLFKEYQSIAKELDTAMLRQTFSHDQIVLFNKIDDYALPQVQRSAKERADLRKQMERDIADIRGLRDRLRGTYGASKDPHNITSRFIRGMKSFNALVGMGGAVIASVPDVARTVMVEGVTMTYEKGMRHFFKSNQSVIKKMARDELNAAAVAGDAVLGLRASAFSDISDVFGSRYSFERKLNQSAGVLFIINGLNIWNQTLKEFAGTVTALRMTKHIMQDWNSLSKANKEKFLKNGIDQSMHRRMKAQIDQHGEVVDGEFMPNTAAWTDATARQTFRNALNQNVERIIVTPGAGDRALWTSTEFGSLLTQFKSYGQGSMVRMLTSGLQERDGAFWQGAFLLIGLGAVVNEMKRYQYGIDKDENFQAKLLNAVDRSGVLGWFSDVNNAVEKLSDYKMGLGPMTGAEKGQYMPYQAKLSAIGGPGIANFLTAGSVAADVLTFNANQKTLNNARFITPGATLPYLDPIFDGIYGQ